jgi:Flp pilus assembly protein TadG
MKYLKKFKSQKGQSLVEFALVLPILILLLFGMIEFGRLWETMNVMTSAAREGARVAATTTPDVNQVNNTVTNVLNAANINNPNITVTGPDANQNVIVTVQINYIPISGAIVPGITNFNLTRTSTMRWEG